MHQFLYCVGHPLLAEAMVAWKAAYSVTPAGWYAEDERDFFTFVGVTDQERIEYGDMWELKVPYPTYRKLELLASNSPYLSTLFKAIDAKYES